MFIVFSLLLILIGIFLYFRKGAIGASFYIIGLSVFLEFLIDKTMPTYLGYINPLILFILVLLVLIHLIRFGVSKYNTFILICSFIFPFMYLLILALYRSIDPLKYLDHFQTSVSGVLLFLLFIPREVNNTNNTTINSRLNTEPDTKLIKFLMGILLIQILVGIAQFIGPDSVRAYLVGRSSYFWGGGLVPIEDFLVFNSRFINGTLRRYNHYGCFLGMTVVYLLGKSFFGDRINKPGKLYYLVLTLGIIVVFLSGSRTALICMIIGILLIIYKKNKRAFFWIAGGILLVFLILKPILLYYSSSTRYEKFNNPIARFSELFSFGDVTSFLYSTTLNIGFLLMPYIKENPLFGVGLYYKTGYPSIYIGSGTSTDATIFFILAEYGIIGFILIILPILAIIKIVVSKRNSYSGSAYPLIVIIVVSLLQSIADPGIFYRLNSYTIATIAGVEYLMKGKIHSLRNI